MQAEPENLKTIQDKTAGQDNKTRVKTVKTEAGQGQDKLKKSKDKPQDKGQDSGKDTEPMETASYPENSVVSPSVSKVSQGLSEEDLKKQRDRMLKTKVAREMLENGFAVRDVSQELKLPKGFVEKISKTLRRESPSDSRQKYMSKPYEYAVQKLESADGESLLESGWFERMQRKIWKMKIEADLMKKAGLLGGDGDSGGNSSRINLNEILLAKVVASGGNTSAQELASFAAALKTLFAPQPSQDPLQFYATIKNLENQSVQQARLVESEAYARAKADTNKGFLSQVVDKFAPAINDLAKAVTSTPKIPAPTPLEIPGPDAIKLPEGELLGVAEQPLEGLSFPDSQGYSNLTNLEKKSKLIV